MSFVADRASIVTEIERARAAWSEYTLLVDYENKGIVDLSLVTKAYLMVDIVEVDGEQLDLGPSPLVCDYGQIIVAAGAKEGNGMVEQVKLLDHIRPYLQLRDNLGNVRTHAAQRQLPRKANGFYYLPMIIGFWSVAAAPAVP